jgi:two-component system phosphate regulon response regulator PhoB
LNHKDYRNIGTLVAVDSAEMQASLIDAFQAAGFDTLRQANSEAQLREALSAADLDLIVMSSVIKDRYVAPMISEIRRGKLGPRPFPIVIALVTDTDPGALRQVSNCGPDDIIALPCAPQTLLDRINLFLGGARRPLVVTEGYAGPERRNSPRD